MDLRADSSPVSQPETHANRGVALFQAALRERPVRTGLALGVEYATFASAASFALGLLATRVPLRIADRVLGLRTRERFIELIARVSPG